MAQVAHDIQGRHGYVLPETVAYGVLLKRWEACANTHGLLQGLEDNEAISILNDVLNPADAAAVRAHYESQGKDAALYFYEEFLRAYDPASARGRGVLYTPPEIVGFMIRGVDSILRERFGSSLSNALVVDPCCGVGTFLRHIERRTDHRPRMIGMELMPAQAAIARCLTPTAEIVCADWLSQASLPVDGRPMVIIGNPPYSGHSSNAGKIADLMADYRAGLSERNPKWLQDDYVKFIRMAQHQIELAGSGIVALITNHSFLFNPTFRTMRESLVRTFDEIALIDLGGNVKQLSKCDGNVFPIQMGVAISFMVKAGTASRCAIRYAAIEGSRPEKLSMLSEADLPSLRWSGVTPTNTFSLFTPHDNRLADEFYGFASLFDIFGQSTIGFVTSRDAFAIGSTRDEVLERIAAIRDGRMSNEALRHKYSVGDLDLDRARKVLRSDPDWESRATEVLYRPFDRRWVYYSRAIMERPRLPFMDNLIRDNVALAIGRAGQVTGSDEWDVVFCTDRPADLNLFRRGGAKLFPRYAYRGDERLSNMLGDGDQGRLFGYIYALLHSREYRARYAAMLMVDYPRIPMPPEPSALSRLSEIGRELIDAHLLPSSVHPPKQTSLTGEGAAAIHIGGYEVPRKWLADRASVASDDQIAHVLSAVQRTIELREQIDQIVAKAPPWS